MEKQIVVFKLADEDLGLGILNVKEIIKPVEVTKIPSTISYIKGIINLRNEIIVVVDLKEKLGIKSDEENEDRIIICELNGTNIGLIVNRCDEVLRITEESIKDAPALIHSNIDSDCIDDIVTLDDRLIILLDLYKLFSKEELGTLKKIKK